MKIYDDTNGNTITVMPTTISKASVKRFKQMFIDKCELLKESDCIILSVLEIEKYIQTAKEFGLSEKFTNKLKKQYL